MRGRRQLEPREWLALALGLAVAAAALTPLGWLALRGAEAGGLDALLGVVTRDSGATVARSAALSFGVAALCVALALPAAWLTEATDLPGRRLWRVLLVLPLAVPSYVSGFVVVAAFGPAGWAASAGLRLPEVYGGFGATIALLFAYPYALLPIRAAIAELDPDVWNAARSMGCSPARAMTRVVLPALRPAIATGGILVALYVLSDFGAVSLTRFRTLSYVVYLRYQSLFGREEAVLYGIWLVGVAALLLAARRAVRGRPTATLRRGSRRAWEPIPLGRWRPVALAYCAALSAFGVLLPLGVVGYWLARGLANGAPIHPFGDALWNTLAVGVGGAAVVLAAGWLIAALPRTRASFFIRQGAYVGYALPGIVVALALVVLATRAVPALYQTVPLLLFAYVVRFVPIAGATLTTHREQLDPRLQDAARSMGKTPPQVARTVTLPLLVPALWAAYLAAFLSVIKELPATLLLAPLEFNTLATHIWAQTEEAFFTSVALPVLLLVLIAGAVVTARRH